MAHAYHIANCLSCWCYPKYYRSEFGIPVYVHRAYGSFAVMPL